jgi:F0F1-type ATP synthase membrane subunit a
MLDFTWFQFATAFAAVIVTVVLVWVCYAAGENARERAVNVLVGFFGLAVGWLAGIVLSPFTKEEGALFANYAGAVSAFVTGYAAGKVDDLVKYVLNPQNLTKRRAFHGVLFLVTFIVALIVVFEFRYYATLRQAVGNPPPQQSSGNATSAQPTPGTPK